MLSQHAVDVYHRFYFISAILNVRIFNIYLTILATRYPSLFILLPQLCSPIKTTLSKNVTKQPANALSVLWKVKDTCTFKAHFRCDLHLRHGIIGPGIFICRNLAYSQKSNAPTTRLNCSNK